MLDPRVAEITERLIATQFVERRQELSRQLLTTGNHFNSRGTFHSSMHLQAVANLCFQEIDIRAQIVFRTHVRVLSQLNVEPYPEMAQDLKQRLDLFVSLVDDYAGSLNDLRSRLGPMSISISISRIHETRDHVLSKLGAEIDLFAESLLRQQQQRSARDQGQPVINNYGTVGAFQMGSGSVANVTQHIGSQEKETLRAALSEVKGAINALSDEVRFPKTEVIEMVDDATIEIAKPAPNRVKLATILTGVGDAVKILGDAKETYQLLKTALLPFNIMLP